MKLLMIVLLGISSVANAYDCKFKQEMDSSLAISSAVKTLNVDVGAGSLEIIGKKGAEIISINALACSNKKDAISKLKVLAKTKVSEAMIKTETPDSFFEKSANSRIDLKLIVPQRLMLDVDDSSGSIVVENVAELKVDDSSGSITIKNVDGNVSVDDSSGSINISDVRGIVELDDSSGGISVTQVTGSVIVHSDSSGAIKIENVEQDVLIKDDSSGSIAVNNIRGNFTVKNDGSGAIRYNNVSGTVKIPSNKKSEKTTSLVF